MVSGVFGMFFIHRKRTASLPLSETAPCGGDSWTRTNDPIDVNDVLYRLSHATLYIFYDASATFSRTTTPRQSGGR